MMCLLSQPVAAAGWKNTRLLSASSVYTIMQENIRAMKKSTSVSHFIHITW
jgi:hypothetical protein